MKLRVAHCSFIYRKALKLSRKAQGESTIGQMVNLLSNDVNRFDYSAFFIHYFWIGPLQLLVVLYITYTSIGPACFVGAGLIVAFVPLQSEFAFNQKLSSCLDLAKRVCEIKSRIYIKLLNKTNE